MESDASHTKKKRKHTKVLETDQETQTFKKTLSDFIDSNICESENPRSFISTHEIISAFKKKCNVIKSETLFSKELHNQMSSKFSNVIQKQCSGSRGYSYLIFNTL